MITRYSKFKYVLNVIWQNPMHFLHVKSYRIRKLRSLVAPITAKMCLLDGVQSSVVQSCISNNSDGCTNNLLTSKTIKIFWLLRHNAKWLLQHRSIISKRMSYSIFKLTDNCSGYQEEMHHSYFEGKQVMVSSICTSVGTSLVKKAKKENIKGVPPRKTAIITKVLNEIS